jgi:hypothetical protein
VRVVGAVDPEVRVVFALYLQEELYAARKFEPWRLLRRAAPAGERAETDVERFLGEIPCSPTFLREQVHVGLVVGDAQVKVLVPALAGRDGMPRDAVGDPIDHVPDPLGST